MLRRRVTAVAAACVLVAGGCTHHAASSADPPTSTTVPASSTPPSSIDVTKVPPVIDLGYVTEVMKAINHVGGDAARHVYEVKRLDSVTDHMLSAIFAGTRLEEAKQNFRDDIAFGLDRFYANPPGDSITTVDSILSSSGTCIVAKATTDVSPRLQKPIQPLPGAVVQLSLKDPGADPDHLNPSPWVVRVDGVPKVGQDLSRFCS